MTADFSHCRTLVERFERDRFLATAFVPEEKRDELCALYAFDAEISGIPGRTSEPMPGEIRLQWWRDAITGEAENVGHPVADALRETIRRNDLPIDAFDRFLEARIFDLYDDPMPSRFALEAYAGETASTLIMLAARILSPASANAVADAAGHAGVVGTVAHILSPPPWLGERWRNYVPADLLSAVGATSGDLSDEKGEARRRALEALTTFGLEHAGKFDRLLPEVPTDVRAAFLPPALSMTILRRHQRRGFARRTASIEPSALRKSFLYWRWMRA